MHDKCVHSSENTLSTGVHSITVHIVDTGTSSNANPAENITSSAVTVNVDPVLTAPVITPSSSTISADQNVVLTSTTSNGGTGVYTYTWNDGATVLPCTTNVCTVPKGTLPLGAQSITVHIVDTGNSSNANPAENITSSPVAVMVDPVPTAPVITPSSSTISADQNVVLTSTTSNGGTGVYTYTWNDGATVLPCTTNVCTVPKGTLPLGAQSITVHIVDTGTSSNANPAENITSSAVTVNVDPVLTAPVITPSSSTISADQNVVLTSTTSNGGTGVYTYTWNDGATVLPCTTNVCTVPKGTLPLGAQSITVHIVDTGTSSNANPAENITSSAVTVNVDPVLTAPVITPSSSTISADQNVVLTSTTSNGGTGVYHIHME